MFLGQAATALAHAPRLFGVMEKLENAGRYGFGIARRNDDPGRFLGASQKELVDTANIGGYDRNTGGHRFQNRYRASFGNGAQYKKVQRGDRFF